MNELNRYLDRGRVELKSFRSKLADTGLNDPIVTFFAGTVVGASIVYGRMRLLRRFRRFKTATAIPQSMFDQKSWIKGLIE
jgi:hypothetical protein